MSPRSSSPTDLSIDLALFRQKKPLDEFPVFDGSTSSKTAVAKRNTSGAAHPSLLLTKALLSVLLGNLTPAFADADTVLVKAASMSGGGTTEAALNWATNTWSCLYGSTYHVGLLAFAEAIANAPLAKDFCEAWAGLLEYLSATRSLSLPLSITQIRDLQDDVDFRECLICACDELYFWARYRDQGCDSAHDRIANVFVQKIWPKPKLASPADLTPILLEATAVRRRATRSGAAAPTTTPTPPVSSGKFKGPQKAILLRALEDRTATLLFGQTASGKNTCVNEVLAELGWGYEAIGGKEGLTDLDFVGSLTKTKKGLTWVDGPLGRAMRRAATEPIILFIDEFTRIRPEQVNLLIDLLNEVPEELMLASGAKLPGKSARGLYRRVEVPQCEEPFVCPAENLVVVTACNRGRAYSTYEIDPAMMRRLPRRIEFRYLAPDAEAALLVEKSTAPLDAKIAKSCVAVATKARQMAETAEVAAPLDPGSLIYWASQLAERLKAESIAWNGSATTAVKNSLRTRIITIAQEEAESTWIPAVLAPDLSGVLPLGKITALKDMVREQFTANLT